MDAETVLYGKPKKRRERSKTERLKDSAFHEVKVSPPVPVQRTEAKKGKQAARKQEVAIALEKARRKGARIPKK